MSCYSWKRESPLLKDDLASLTIDSYLFIFGSQNKLHPYERALYGSLAGDLASVLPVCKSWDDHLWAHLNAMIENRWVLFGRVCRMPCEWTLMRRSVVYQPRMTQRLKQVGGYWQSRQAGSDDVEEMEETLKDVFDQIERTDRDGVA